MLGLAGLALSLASIRGADTQGTGMRPATPAERQWMDEHLINTKKVRLNDLALQRLNAHRLKQGLEVLQIPVVPQGQEVVPEGAGETLSALSSPAGLPDSIDNSTMPSFPPIRNQGGLSACTPFSSTYYAATHMLGLARGFDNRNNDDNSTKLSPKWVYNMINGGSDSGSFFAAAFKVLQLHGAATWADFPYTADTNSVNYREWPLDPSIWRKAITYRMADSGKISAVDTPEGLNNIKTLLANGYVLVFATDIYGWQFATVGDDPGTDADNAFVGKPICAAIKVNDSGHALTIVGYNDNIWVDLNKNGVVDAGEKGALRLANSWGKDWANGDGGFTWLSYDALKAVSAVKGVDNTSRAPSAADPTRSPFWYNEAYWITARPGYTPKLLAQFVVNHKSRAELGLSLGASSTRSTTPATNWFPATLEHTGGKFGFSGSTNAVDGTFVLDLSELSGAGPRYYLNVEDTAAGNTAQISDFRLTDSTGATLTIATNNVPLTVDNATNRAYVGSFTYDPPLITSATNASATVGIPFTFTITASKPLANFTAAGLPAGLTLNPLLGVISGKPARAGIFNVSLAANGASGTGSGILKLNIQTGFVPAPVISSVAAASGTVGQNFSYTIVASDFPDFYGASGLPKGLDLNTSSGVISGTIIEAGTFGVQLSAVNTGGTGTKHIVITVNPPPAGSPVIISPVTASVTSGNRFTYRITASNGPTSFGAVNLPGELSLDSSTGVITGIPRLARQYTIILSARNGIGVGYQTLVLSILGDSSFGPGNDNFVNRPELIGTNVNITAGNFNATAETAEPDHSGYPANKSVWWTWTAPANGLVNLNVANSDFTAVAGVYTGTNVATLAAVQRADAGTTSQTIDFNATAGTSYQIAVDGQDGAAGTINLSLRFNGAVARPANDDFSGRIIVTGTNLTMSAQNLNASKEAGEPNHDGKIASKSIWWSWTAPGAGIVTISTKGSDFDTVLAVYTGASLANLSPVVSDDESGGNGTSQVVFLAAAGTTYQIAVDGYNGAEGQVQFLLNFAAGTVQPANDNFAQRITLSGTNVTATGDNNNATAEPGEPRHVGYSANRSLWWTWTAPQTGLATIDTVGSDFDTLLAVYRGDALNLLSEVASNDDGGGNSTSSLYFNAVAGVVYQIAVDGFDGAGRGRGTIALHIKFQGGSPANDNFADAISLSGPNANVTSSNQNATSEPDEPDHAGSTALRSVWWSWTAPSAGLVTISTAGSDFDTVLGVYQGSSVSQLAEVTSNDDDGADSTSRVDFVAEQGVTYKIAVDGFEGISGKISLTLTLIPGNGTLYQTDFEDFPSGWARVVGTDGWKGINADGQVEAIVNAFPGGGKGVLLGGGVPQKTNGLVSLYRPINYDPVGQGTPLVSFQVKFAIFDSTTAFKDEFDFTVYNRAGDFIASVIFDNDSHNVFYEDAVGAVTQTPKTFIKNGLYTVNVSMNFLANSWSANLSGGMLFTNQPFNISGKKLDLGYIAMEWLQHDPLHPGDNEIAFDDFSVTAGASTSPPLITSQPQGADLIVGNTVSFHASAVGFPSPTFQWLKNGVPLEGKTGPNLDLINVTLADAGTFIVIASNTVGVASSASAVLTVSLPPPGPAISVQPVSQTVSEGGATLLTVVASGAGQLTYQWKLNGTNIPGATSVTYRLTNSLAANSGSYTVLVSDSTGSTLSQVSDLVVNPPGIIYSTAFEASEGYTSAKGLTAQKGWVSAARGASGITNVFAGLGQQAYIGLVPPDGTNNLFLAWKPLNFAPNLSSNPVVRFSSDLEILDSSNGHFDSFGWSSYNVRGSQLFAVSFNNADKKVYYSLNDEAGLTATAVKFTNGALYHFMITMDFSKNMWSATLGASSIVTNMPITVARASLDLGDIDAFWLFNSSSIGNNAMVFDNYKVESIGGSAPSVPTVRFLPVKSTDIQADGSFQMTFETTGTANVTVQVSTNLVSWQNLGVASQSGNTATFTDKSGNARAKFYRATAH